MDEILVDPGEVSDGYHTFNELYEHRHALFIALAGCLGQDGYAWKSRLHNDGTSFEGWFLAGIELENIGQVTYHLPDRLWDACFAFGTLNKGLEWDGHTANDVIERLARFSRKNEPTTKSPQKTS